MFTDVYELCRGEVRLHLVLGRSATGHVYRLLADKAAVSVFRGGQWRGHRGNGSWQERFSLDTTDFEAWEEGVVCLGSLARQLPPLFNLCSLGRHATQIQEIGQLQVAEEELRLRLERLWRTK